MSSLRAVVEKMMGLIQADILPGATIVPADDPFEIKATPSLLVQGPTLTQDLERRSMAKICETNLTDNSYVMGLSPAYYNLDFDIVVNTSNVQTLLDLQEKCALFFRQHAVLTVSSELSLRITELVPVGGFSKINLSNLRRAAGRFRIEDFPVFSGDFYAGKLILKRTIEYQNGNVPTEVETASYTD